MNSEFPTVTILGSRVHVVSLDGGVSTMAEWIQGRDGRCRQIVVTGFHGLWEAHRNPEFKAILNSADLWLPDGIAPVWVARLRGFSGARRIPGAELMEAFFARANEKGYRSFFYGDTEETLSALRRKVEREYPGHKVVGVLSPPFRRLSREEEEVHVRVINQAKPDVLWVGLGLPKQDRWIHRHREHLEVPVALGVGAAFRFVNGAVKRAPAWLGNLGCEWAYRLLREPKKCWRRSLIGGPQFVLHVLLEMAGIRTYK